MADFAGVTPSATHTPSDEEETRSSGGPSEIVGKSEAGSSGKKPRGRPPGSKNKPKPPVIITKESEPAMRPVVFELAAGSDVIESLSQFSRRREVGLCVLSGSGTVANLTLRHPTSHSATLSLRGRFDILSVSGTFMPPNSTFTTSSLTVSLAGPQGQVIGGTVAGTLVAAGPLVLIAATYVNPSVHQLPSEETGQEMKSPSAIGGDSGNGNMAMSVYGVAAPISQIPPEVFPWPPISRPPHL